MDVEEGETNVINFGDIAMSFCADSCCNSLVQNLGNIIGTETNEAGESLPVKVYPMSQTERLNTTPYKFILENTENDIYDGLAKIISTENIEKNKSENKNQGYDNSNILYEVKEILGDRCEK